MTDAAVATTPPAEAPPVLDQGAYDKLEPGEKLGYARQFDQGKVRSGDAPVEPKPGDKPIDKPATPEAAKAESGKFKFGALELTEQEIADLVAHKAAADSRKLAAPQSPELYRVELPTTFEIPKGTEFKLDLADPLWGQARSWAHKNGLSQEAFQEAIGLVAGRDLITHQKVQTARNGEIAKLGATGPARIDAVEQFYKGLLGSADAAKAVMTRVFTAADVQIHERIMQRFASQVHAPFSAAHRDPVGAERVTDAEYAAMSAGDKFNYARGHDQRQFGHASGQFSGGNNQ